MIKEYELTWLDDNGVEAGSMTVVTTKELARVAADNMLEQFDAHDCIIREGDFLKKCINAARNLSFDTYHGMFPKLPIRWPKFINTFPDWYASLDDENTEKFMEYVRNFK